MRVTHKDWKMHFWHFVNTVHKESSFSPHANCKGQLHRALAPSSSRSCQTRVSSPLHVKAHLAICQPELSSFHSTSGCFFCAADLHWFFCAGTASYLICKRDKSVSVKVCQRSLWVSSSLADSEVLWFCGFVIWQIFLFTFTLYTKSCIDLGTSRNMWENLANLKPKLEKNFHHVSGKCSGSSYLDFALVYYF